jgi:hypothetical protein
MRYLLRPHFLLARAGRLTLAFLLLLNVVLGPARSSAQDPGATSPNVQRLIRPGQGVGQFDLGMTIEQALAFSGRLYDDRRTSPCWVSHRWSYQPQDSALTLGASMSVWTPIYAQRRGDRIFRIEITGDRSAYETGEGIKLGSSREEVTGTYGAPGHEEAGGQSTTVRYEQKGLAFVISNLTGRVASIIVTWPLLASRDVRPTEGIGPLRLGMDWTSAEHALGRPQDFDYFGYKVWALLSTTYFHRYCDPNIRAFARGDGKISTVNTTARGFKTPGGVQVGDPLEAIVGEMGPPLIRRPSPDGKRGEYWWPKFNLGVEFQAHFDTLEGGERRISAFLVRRI